MPFAHEDKKAGDVLTSQAWNEGMREILRLDKDKIDRKGDTITGSLTIGDALTVMGNTTLSAGMKGAVSVLSLKGQLSKDIAAKIVLQNSDGGVGGGGSLDFNGYDVNTDSVPTARIQSINDDDRSSHLSFSTKSAKTNKLCERLRITSKGSLVIGADDVKATLQVIGTSDKTTTKTLQVIGATSITSGEGQNYANAHDRMKPGSLTIGSITESYGGGLDWSTNTAGLLLETLDNTEIVVHDFDKRLASFMYYSSKLNQFTIGRDIGYHVRDGLPIIEIAGNLHVKSSIKTRLDLVEFNKDENWHLSTHPIRKYFLKKLDGEPKGTMIMAICDYEKWASMIWVGLVAIDGKIRVNHLNWKDTNIQTL